MKGLIIAALGVLLLCSATPQSYFEGRIDYKKKYTDFNGRDISAKVAAYFDKEEVFYADEANYKVLNEKQQFVKLYNGNTHAYYFFNRDKTAYKIDIKNRTSQHVMVQPLREKAMVAGFECQAVKVESDLQTMIVFFNPDIKVNTSVYGEYYLNELNEVFKATKGALPLKTITIDRRAKFITTTEAVRVNFQDLAAREFYFPKDVRLKHLKFGIEMH